MQHWKNTFAKEMEVMFSIAGSKQRRCVHDFGADEYVVGNVLLRLGGKTHYKGFKIMEEEFDTGSGRECPICGAVGIAHAVLLKSWSDAAQKLWKVARACPYTLALRKVGEGVQIPPDAVRSITTGSPF